ncbi:unnamed protein product [Paramecium pentaurelia]|uniref:Uncharacterized protein n=1 Tax=Paramecium pentaurelia TaxID=43138 RepID=A0A8S1UMG3_9CILI|nr:unnamed protein product [Paramecium pentaurelia]
MKVNNTIDFVRNQIHKLNLRKYFSIVIQMREIVHIQRSLCGNEISSKFWKIFQMKIVLIQHKHISQTQIFNQRESTCIVMKSKDLDISKELFFLTQNEILVLQIQSEQDHQDQFSNQTLLSLIKQKKLKTRQRIFILRVLILIDQVQDGVRKEAEN